jgi:hypothetical protein
MAHVVLLGDSIFDNAVYVPGKPPVIEQLRAALPAGWSATLLAVDGHVTEDVARQFAGCPNDATHLVVSVGGNDALGESGILREPVHTVGEASLRMGELHERFAATYREMLGVVCAAGKPVTVCTVYDSIPNLGLAERTALAAFNDVILREAFRRGIAVIDLRLVCDRAGDYSEVSPIEPSAAGGAKIAAVIAAAVTGSVPPAPRSVIHR